MRKFLLVLVSLLIFATPSFAAKIPNEVKKILDENGFSMQKKFGQNFLINGAARTKLIDALDVNENTTVWEVGPGLGAMTSELLERGTNLTVFEIDRGFISLISQFFKDFSDKQKFRIIEGDVIKLHLSEK